jgi:hypothetical protein
VDIVNIKGNLEENIRKNKEKSKTLDEISFKLNAEKPAMQIEGTLEEILGRARGLESKIAGSEVELIRKSIDQHTKNEEKALGQIRSNGFTESQFEGVAIGFTQNDVDAGRKTLISLNSKVRELNESEHRMFGDVNRLEGLINQRRTDIEKRFNQSPYEFESLESVDEASFNAQIDAYLKKRQKTAKKLEETESRRGKLVNYGSKLEDFINENGICIESSSRERMDSLVFEGESISMWDMLQLQVERIAVIANKNRENYRELKKSLGAIETRIKESYDELYRDADWAENITVRAILENILKTICTTTGM